MRHALILVPALLACLAATPPADAGETRPDREPSDSYRLYDAKGRYQGRVHDGRIFDASGRFVGRIRHGRIYDAKGGYQGRIDPQPRVEDQR
ncbi:4-fold beta flower protein [Desulfolutivibrio sulfoxidireducens]|uniref:4-fold beta flower protein n=1 Tax=Desulfolutivibrio sulfoxidireducens TaxID=2773299 RepID=UPI00159DF32F|nr:hypothetical protein [Desulfolutivibrio sulfoxidireducens]QLA19337.1 hypothetical protein GD604_06025 [Desulfolutivibrio sulfoxidireducens]